MAEIFWNDYGMLKLKRLRKPRNMLQKVALWFKQRFVRNKARDMYLKM
jgi:hypothetical protein